MLFKSDAVGTMQSRVISVDKKNNRSKHILLNSSGHTVYQYHLDGGIIKHSPNNISKCDYIIEVDSPKEGHAFFIELKGKEITRALDQLSGTIKLFLNPEICPEFQESYQGSLDGYCVHLRVIATKNDKVKSIMQPHERALLNTMKQLKSLYKIKFDSKEDIVRQAGNIHQVTDTV